MHRETATAEPDHGWVSARVRVEFHLDFHRRRIGQPKLSGTLRRGLPTMERFRFREVPR